MRAPERREVFEKEASLIAQIRPQHGDGPFDAENVLSRGTGMMQPPCFDPIEIRRKGWCQGAVLPPNSREIVTEQSPAFGDNKYALAIVVSQDCDIVHDKLEAEPWVEYVLAFPCDRVDGNFSKGKNPRVYQLRFETNLDSLSGVYRISAHDRYRLSRTWLCGWEPNPLFRTDPTELRSLIHWLAMRYIRPAFPDEFNNRLSRKRSRIRDLLKGESGHCISGIFIGIDEEELPENEPYEVRLWVSMRKNDYEVPAKREKAGKLLLDLECEMSQCDGILILDEEESRCRSEEEISLHDLRVMFRMSSFDDLSFDDELSMPGV